MRQFTLDDQVVKCPNSSTLGFSDWKCKRGDIVVFKEYCQDGSYNPRLGRSLGRITCAKDGLENCTGHICAIVPTESFNFAMIRWIDPNDVLEARNCPRRIPELFFQEWGPHVNNDVALRTAKEIDNGYWSEPIMPNIKDLTDHQLLQELGDCETRVHLLKAMLKERNRLPNQKGLEDRIEEIESIVHPPGEVSGTTISRVLGEGEGSGVRWGVGLGMMGMPKVYGYGSTISLALEDAFQKFKETK